MNRKNNNVFLSDKKSSIMTMSGLSALFFMGLTIQVVFSFAVTRIYVSVILIALTFLFNIFLGTAGMILAMSWNMLQLIVYGYEYSRYGDRVSVYLIAMALISMIITLLFRIFVSRVSGVIYELRGKIDDEKTRRLSREESSLISESAVRSGGLILTHRQMGDYDEVSEAIAMSRSAGLDPLTTLPNRDRFIDHIGRLIDKNIISSREQIDGHTEESDAPVMPIYTIYLSVDDTDEIRKKEGHKRLDLFVQSMAHRIREIADSADMVGHIAGTEFVVATSRGISEDGLLFYIDSLRKAAASSFRSKKGDSIVTVSAGYSRFPADGRFPGELLSMAEAAMSEAQKSGGDSVRASVQPTAITRRVGLMSKMTAREISDVLEKAFYDGHLRMVYQPRFDRDDKLTGFEAFIRLSTLGTPELMDAAVMTGNLARIGSFSLAQATRRLSEINRLDPELSMTINLSAEQLRDNKLATEIRRAVDVAECNPNNLIFDIPEESLLGASENVKPLLDDLTAMGIRIALDNFGRGYSSLNNVPLLPISSLNLDGNFTDEIPDNEASGILTSVIIELLDEIDIPVCATGVENKSQYDNLYSFGCASFQGKYKCEPLEDDKLEAYILSHIPSEAEEEISGFELDI